MIDNLPVWLDVLFIATVILTIIFFHYANGRPRYVTIIILLIGAIQSSLAYNGFYQNTQSIPPRFLLVLIPSTIFILYGLLAKQRKWVLANRNIKISTFLHTVRIPVEITLYYLFIHEMVPELMTFKGRNYDILVGISALLVSLLVFKKHVSTQGLLLWNVVGLFFVCFILINGILSAELPFQQFAFDQPNRALSYFPYVFLPAIVVPIVIYTHITDIMKLKSIQLEKDII
jgi:hypothetical protein